MKIYYAHSIRGNHNENELKPLQVIEYLKSIWHEVLSEEIWTWNVKLSDKDIYIRDTQMITDCDIILSNISNISTGVWYEIWFWESIGKKIICFYENNIASIDKISAMITGNPKIYIFWIDKLEDIYANIK